jgi:hypothetical protein
VTLAYLVRHEKRNVLLDVLHGHFFRTVLAHQMHDRTSAFGSVVERCLALVDQKVHHSRVPLLGGDVQSRSMLSVRNVGIESV